MVDFIASAHLLCNHGWLTGKYNLMRKEIRLLARLDMEDFGLILLLSDAEMLRVGFY